MPTREIEDSERQNNVHNRHHRRFNVHVSMLSTGWTVPPEHSGVFGAYVLWRDALRNVNVPTLEPKRL